LNIRIHVYVSFLQLTDKITIFNSKKREKAMYFKAAKVLYVQVVHLFNF